MMTTDAPKLGFEYVLLHGRATFHLGKEFVVNVQHDPQARTGPVWFVQVMRNNRVILVACGTKTEVERRWQDWADFIAEKQRLMLPTLPSTGAA